MFVGKQPLKTAVIQAFRWIQELEYALFRPVDDVGKHFRSCDLDSKQNLAEIHGTCYTVAMTAPKIILII